MACGDLNSPAGDVAAKDLPTELELVWKVVQPRRASQCRDPRRISALLAGTRPRRASRRSSSWCSRRRGRGGPPGSTVYVGSRHPRPAAQPAAELGSPVDGTTMEGLDGAHAPASAEDGPTWPTFTSSYSGHVRSQPCRPSQRRTFACAVDILACVAARLMDWPAEVMLSMTVG
jgi:hypothetical protein